MSHTAEFAIAFDVPTLAEALALDARLGKGSEYAKIGLELFAAEGPAAVRELKARGRRVFLDLKLHDIPNTVRGAAASAARVGADLLTVHATGGAPMIRAAVEGAAGFTRPFSLHEVAAQMVAMAEGAGALGVVCSAADLAGIRAALGRPFYAVTPGIRMAGADAHDQKRVATVERAVRGGASLLVLGRAVTAAADPRAALAAARAERDRALAAAGA